MYNITATVIEAKDIPKSNAYVRILVKDRQYKNCFKGKTQVVKKTNQPLWQKSFVVENVKPGSKFIFEVYNKSIGRGTLLGFAETDINLPEMKNIWLNLRKGKKLQSVGKIRVEFQFSLPTNQLLNTGEDSSEYFIETPRLITGNSNEEKLKIGESSHTIKFKTLHESENEDVPVDNNLNISSSEELVPVTTLFTSNDKGKEREVPEHEEESSFEYEDPEEIQRRERARLLASSGKLRILKEKNIIEVTDTKCLQALRISEDIDFNTKDLMNKSWKV